ncbi:PadR family transcriptional regulator [Streptomyces sp. NPDC127084]|uniref:PadR family transcriptional regulator n=1 Tax=Streptomyces sp. NPDC127084 TaxID=3347133 RepID=UPI003651C5CE
MSLKYAVLAALLNGEASGYDLAKVFDVAVANFWSSTPQQLYRELDRLATDGLIEARVVQQERRPNKRMFSLTPTGRDALHTFTLTPPRPTTIRDELMVKIQAMDEADPDAVRVLIEECLERISDKLARYERLRDRMLDGRTEDEYLIEAEQVGPYLTLMRGRAFEEENVRWCERTLEVLAARAARRGAAHGSAAQGG